MRFLKEAVKTLFYRPRGIHMGPRSFILRPFHIKGRSCISIGAHTSLLRGASIHAIQTYAGHNYQPTITIGSNVYIGKDVYITSINSITIGDGCVLSDGVYLTDEVHGIDPLLGPIMQQSLHSKGPVTIENQCFLGFRVAILPGVHLGHHCVVGANSTVTHSFPPFSMVAGSPARLIKRYHQVRGEWITDSSTFPLQDSVT
jgi:acetyltransferase-like isoleucine patch superfamily enzyme